MSPGTDPAAFALAVVSLAMVAGAVLFAVGRVVVLVREDRREDARRCSLLQGTGVPAVDGARVGRPRAGTELVDVDASWSWPDRP